MAAYYVPCLIAVRKDSPYKTFNDLYQALKNNPANTIKNSIAGIGSSGYNAVMVLSATDATMGKGLNTPYAGGADAIKALLAGEVDFTSQLSNEMIDLLRSGDLRALCALTAEDLNRGCSQDNPVDQELHPGAGEVAAYRRRLRTHVPV